MRLRALGGLLVSALTLGLSLASGPARASSHSEAPGTAKDRLADDTDLYAWVSPDAADRGLVVQCINADTQNVALASVDHDIVASTRDSTLAS